MDEIKNVLAGFEHILLQDMERVALMDRFDTKYIFHVENLPEILKSIQKDYQVLYVNDCNISKYESLYFDTPEFDLYHYHLQGKLNRYKFRFRKYIESNLLFFEIKFKNNKGRTKKTRTKYEDFSFSENQALGEFIKSNSNLQSSELEEKMWVNYSRITLVNKTIAERVTLDLNLTFKNDAKEVTLSQIVVAEVKQDKSMPSPFVLLMREKHIREGFMSKYCLGIIHLFSHIKANPFKPQLLKVKKISKTKSAHVH